MFYFYRIIIQFGSVIQLHCRLSTSHCCTLSTAPVSSLVKRRVQVDKASDVFLLSLVLSQDSEFVCLEFDEAKVNQVLKKMADIQQSIDSIVQRT